MATTDAMPIPRKNVAYRVTFPLLDADGDLVTGASALDSEVSKDAGTFTDCTNEATEIATNSGMYYLELTSTEMNADCVAIIVKTSTSGAKTVPIVLYPQETGDIKVDVDTIKTNPVVNAGTITFPTTATLASTTNITAGTIATVTSVTGLTASNLDATISSRASQTSVDTIDDFVDTEVAAIKAQTDKLTFDGANMVVADARKISTSSVAADNLEAGAEALIETTCAVGSTTTSIVTNLTEATDDHYNGRVITFTTGALTGQATNITDYNGTTKTLTVTALTEAPSNSDVFVIS